MSEHQRLVGLRLIESVPFAGEELTNPTLKGHGPRGQVDSFTAVRLDVDGRMVPISANQRADGIALDRDFLNRDTNKPAHERVVVGLSGIRGYIYAAEVSPPVDAKK